MDKLRRIFPLMMVYVAIVCINIFIFAHLYEINNSIIDPNAESSTVVTGVTRRDILYFSGITYLTIGYGDFKTVNGIGQFLAVLQGFSGVLINSVFTGLFLYYLVKRPKNVILSNNIYIRYKEEEDQFYLSIRIGNKGRPLVNVNRILELFIYEDKIRTRQLQLSQEYHYLESTLHWEIDLSMEANHDLLRFLQSATLNNRHIYIRISILGTDADAGELIFTSKTFRNSHIVFIEDYYDLFEWKNHRRSKIHWKYFNDVYKLSEDKIKLFQKLK